MKDNENVAIIGGAGNMGRLTADLFREIGFTPIISDPRLPESPTPKEAIGQSRVVFFSILPFEEISKIIDETGDELSADHIVLDNASLKKPLRDAFEALDKKGISICSTHPLCKHDQPLHGQNALIMDFGKNSSQAREIAERLHQNAGMITIPFSFEDHDRAMTVLQLVPHLFMRSVGEVLAKSGVDMKALTEIAPANFQLFNLSLWRNLVQDPNISATIITNLLKEDAGKAIAQGIQDTIADIVAEHDEKALAKRLDATASKLGRESLGSEMNQTTTTILERLANLKARSLVIEVDGDKPGLLREILSPFEAEGVNITAIDSHKTAGKLRFEVGVDHKKEDAEKLQKVRDELKAIGYVVK